MNSGQYNLITEVKDAIVKLRETKAAAWTLSQHVEDFLQEVATGDSQVFARCSPDTKPRNFHSVSDSTMMFGTGGKPLSDEWPNHAKMHKDKVVATSWQIVAGAKASDLLAMVRKVMVEHCVEGDPRSFKGSMAVVCSVNDYRRISSKARKKAANPKISTLRTTTTCT